MTLFDPQGHIEHAALPAADAAQAWKVSLWTSAIAAEISAGNVFSADTLQDKHGLPDLPAVGGLFMRLHRAGTIRRIGYRPSDKPSRAGGIVAVWIAAGVSG